MAEDSKYNKSFLPLFLHPFMTNAQLKRFAEKRGLETYEYKALLKSRNILRIATFVTSFLYILENLVKK